MSLTRLSGGGRFYPTVRVPLCCRHKPPSDPSGFKPQKFVSHSHYMPTCHALMEGTGKVHMGALLPSVPQDPLWSHASTSVTAVGRKHGKLCTSF